MLAITSGALREYLVWLLALALVVFGFRHSREAIAFVLDKLYQIFIQNAPGT